MSFVLTGSDKAPNGVMNVDVLRHLFTHDQLWECMGKLTLFPRTIGDLLGEASNYKDAGVI